MSTLEQEILQQIAKLDAENQRRVLDFVIQLANKQSFSARELMKLPLEQRQHHVMTALEAAADEDFETFEAYREESIVDE